MMDVREVIDHHGDIIVRAKYEQTECAACRGAVPVLPGMRYLTSRVAPDDLRRPPRRPLPQHDEHDEHDEIALKI